MAAFCYRRVTADSISTVPSLLRKLSSRSGAAALLAGAQRKDCGKISTQQSHHNAIALVFSQWIGATSYYPSPLALPFRKVPFSNS
jgi:hypothetical protein